MPTYEYACSSCGNAWEEVQRITEEPIQICPSCKKATAKRQISGGTFILKGGGWYSDLYSSPKSPAGKDDAAKSGGDKSDSKPETKTEAKSEKAETKSEPKKDGGSSSSSSGSSGSSGSAAGGSSGSSGTSKAAAAE